MSGTDVAGWSYRRYLDAKVTVDNRALNRSVVEVLGRYLALHPGRDALRVTELGAGTGTMVKRLLEWKLLTHAEYTLVDADARLLADGLVALREWANGAGFRAEHPDSDTLRLSAARGSDTVIVRTRCAEVSAFLPAEQGGTTDLLIASAFLDLVELPHVVPQLLALLAPRGLFWFPINFDGETIFEPSHALDAPLMAAYHRTMDERVRYGRPAGDSRTGRKLFHALASAGANVHAAGSSDWVVHGQDGKYPGEEAYFLSCILSTIEHALTGRADVAPSDLAMWMAARREQLDRAALVYIAHQLDFVGGK